MRPRIQRKTIDERLVDKYKQVLGLSTRDAWGKIKQVNFRAELQFVSQC